MGIFVFFQLNRPFPVFSQDSDHNLNYRFPEMYNSNALAGRLYLQPVGPHEDQVSPDFNLDLSLSIAAEYRPNFNDTAKSYDPMRYNTNLLTVRTSKGFNLNTLDFEVGGVWRLVQDKDNSFLAEFLRWFHRIIGSKGHIPNNVPYGAVIGNGNASVIGSDGNIYLLSPELYAKFQILEEQEKNNIPNLSLKLSCRVPISNDNFDTWGFGLSTGISKGFAENFRYKAAIALVYQDLYSNDFDATDLGVNRFAYDLFGGIGYDFGNPGGFYSDLGLRYSNERIVYTDNSDSATPAVVVHGAINYLSKDKSWEIFSGFSEEITAISRALEPDFIFSVGASIKF